MSQSVQKLLEAGPIVTQGTKPAQPRRTVPVRLRLVDKPAGTSTVQKQQSKAAEAAARVAARFAAMPAYSQPQASSRRSEAAVATSAGIGQPCDQFSSVAVEQASAFKEQQAMNTSDVSTPQNVLKSRPFSGAHQTGGKSRRGVPFNSSVQLSIFEVPPEELRQVENSKVEPGLSLDAVDAPAQTELSEPAGQELVPAYAAVSPSQLSASPVEFTPHVLETGHTPATQAVEPAAFNRRCMAGCIDVSLVLLAAAAAITIAAHSSSAHIRGIVTPGLLFWGTLAVAILYQAFFTLLMRATPGQAFASLRVVTRDGQQPEMHHLALRLLMLPLSIAPACVGILWALVDQEGLCWHDRFSSTLPKSHY